MSEMLSSRESIPPPTLTVGEAFGGRPIGELSQEEKSALYVLLELSSRLNPDKTYPISDWPTLNVEPIISHFKILKTGVISDLHFFIVDQDTEERLFQEQHQHIHNNNAVIQIIEDKLKMTVKDDIKRNRIN